VTSRTARTASARTVLELLHGYHPHGQDETADVERVRALAGAGGDPWSRALPLHLTASGLIVHPDSGRVLLRWHQRQQAWLQVGGHADPGETDALSIALREAREETALEDLVPWPDGAIRQVVIVPVPAGGREQAHEHADVRFVLATRNPDAARAEQPGAPLRWVALGEAGALTSEANVRELLARVGQLLDS
jgi:8-oxo-dGTP pyrophosphatase MutT (NUDIX family)